MKRSMTVSRRDLIAAAGAAATAVVGSSIVGAPRASAGGASPSAGAVIGGAPVLVVVQLGGGNDALNTLVPDVGLYNDLRPRLKLDFAACVPVPGFDGYRLHPAMAPLAPMLEAGRFAIAAGLGMPGQDRSHFRAFDYWWSANGTSPVQTGWLGRWLAATGGAAPSPLRAVALRSGAVAFRHASVPTIAITNPSRFKGATPKGGKAAELRTAWASGAKGVSGLAGQLWASHQAADEAMALVSSVAGKLPAGTNFNTTTGQLAFAAELIATEPKVQVIQVAAASSLDTHANQLGPHATIWGDIATGLAGMYEQLAASGHDRRVLTVTVSEFGRRVQENASLGCDHGKAGVHFACGPMVTGGLLGGWDLTQLDQGDLPIEVDARRLYASALTWLGGPVDPVLGASYVPLPVL